MSNVDIVIRLENPEIDFHDNFELTTVDNPDDPLAETTFKPPSRIFLRLRYVPKLAVSPAETRYEQE